MNSLHVKLNINYALQVLAENVKSDFNPINKHLMTIVLFIHNALI